jgi:3-hydroxyacyl-[acyl-carrier-protein] dehydratase
MNSTNPEFTLAIPAEHPCYAGHFPGDPLVPGALLVQWVAEKISDVLHGHTPVTLRSMKFLAPVRPGYRCLVALAISGNKLTFTGSCDGTPVFQGQFLLEHAA